MDTSNLIESQASMDSNQPEATRTILDMDPALNDAAANGKFNVFEDIQESLDLLQTPIENTILHIYLTTLVTESGSTKTLWKRFSISVPYYYGKPMPMVKLYCILQQVDNRRPQCTPYCHIGGPWANDIVRIILKMSSLSNLLNEKDIEGNTPLHQQWMSKYITGQSLLGKHPRVDVIAFNGQNLNTFDEAVKERERKIEDRLQKESGAHLVMATLITTVTFAAGITMPGGFVGGEGPHPGSVVLMRSVAFKAFIIIDSISMMLSSCTSILLYLLLPLLDETEYRVTFFNLAWVLNVVAMAAMVLSFITGMYAVLAHSLDLVIPSLIIGLSFFAIFFLIFCKKIKYAKYN
ncbi:hypothetical protein CJ030_MR1G007960 [Morella rubra]|uniref:PGG domain-containing protein n=1 Tax=Morella rubra TaxID=262757 RepID=A0A6A1WSE6_9ROSI|nr:hypothetical protein CJ030_MR1G007960 [Morella rubra]